MLDDLIAHSFGLELIVMGNLMSRAQRSAQRCAADPGPRLRERKLDPQSAAHHSASPHAAPRPENAATLAVLSTLRPAAPGRVRLAASMLYRGRDTRAAQAPCRDRTRGAGAADRGQRRAFPSSGPAAARRRARLHPREDHHRPRRPQARRQCRAIPETAGGNGAAVPRRAGGDRRDAAPERGAHFLARRIALRISRRAGGRLCQRAGCARASRL